MDYTARSPSASFPVVFEVFEVFFFIVFTLEVSVRIFAKWCGFLRNAGKDWTAFDLLTVLIQQIEVMLSFVVPETSPDSKAQPQRHDIVAYPPSREDRLSHALLEMARELRMLVSFSLTSMRSLGWTMLLLVVLIYCVSLCLTQLVTDHRVSTSESPERDALIK